jgi:hypothetical protein
MRRVFRAVCIAVVCISCGGCATQKVMAIGQRVARFNEYKTARVKDDQVTLVYEMMAIPVTDRNRAGGKLYTRWSTVNLNQLKWAPTKLQDRRWPYTPSEIRRFPVLSAPFSRSITIYVHGSEADLSNEIGQQWDIRENTVSAHVLRWASNMDDSMPARIIFVRPNSTKPNTAEFAIAGVPPLDKFNELWALPARIMLIPFALVADFISLPAYVFIGWELSQAKNWH